MRQETRESRKGAIRPRGLAAPFATARLGGRWRTILRSSHGNDGTMRKYRVRIKPPGRAGSLRPVLPPNLRARARRDPSDRVWFAAGCTPLAAFPAARRSSALATISGPNCVRSRSSATMHRSAFAVSGSAASKKNVWVRAVGPSMRPGGSSARQNSTTSLSSSSVSVPARLTMGGSSAPGPTMDVTQHGDRFLQHRFAQHRSSTAGRDYTTSPHR